MINDIVTILVNAIVFPGLVFVGIVAWLTQWFYRKLYARMQNRIGPRFIGPRGILQPIADFFKLLFKEDIVTVVSREKEPIILLSIGIGALIALLAMLPLSPYPLYAENDVILAIYLTLWPVVAMALLGFMTPNPYTAIGASRYMSLMMVCEPLWLISILTPVILVTRVGVTPSYSIYSASLNVWKLWANPFGALILALTLFSAIIVLQCKLMLKPFDTPEAETEIVAGLFTEYTGPKLAYIIMLHDVELVAYSILISYLLLGGPAPFSLLSIQGILVFLVKYLAIIFLVTWIKASTARLRIEQALLFMLKYVLPVSLAAIILATIVPLP